jgi:hypothetical protein
MLRRCSKRAAADLALCRLGTCSMREAGTSHTSIPLLQALQQRSTSSKYRKYRGDISPNLSRPAAVTHRAAPTSQSAVPGAPRGSSRGMCSATLLLPAPVAPRGVLLAAIVRMSGKLRAVD